MNLKLKAALYTAGFFAAIVATSVLVSYIASLMTATQGVYLLGVLCISGMVYSMYGIMLARMEYNETLKRMAEKSVDNK
jgi:glutamate/tyrosine decarboxylase-like PLP-dependent enzyme